MVFDINNYINEEILFSRFKINNQIRSYVKLSELVSASKDKITKQK